MRTGAAGGAGTRSGSRPAGGTADPAKPHRHRCLPGAPGHRIGLQRRRRAGSHGPGQRRAERRNRARAAGRSRDNRGCTCAPRRWWKERWRQPAWPPPAPALAEIASEARNALAGKAGAVGRSGEPLSLPPPRKMPDPRKKRWSRLPNPSRTARAAGGAARSPGAALPGAGDAGERDRTGRPGRRRQHQRRPEPGGAARPPVAHLARGDPKRARRSPRLANFIESGCGEKEEPVRGVPDRPAAHRPCRPSASSAASRRPRASPSARWSSSVPPPWNSAPRAAGTPEAERQRLLAAVGRRARGDPGALRMGQSSPGRG